MAPEDAVRADTDFAEALEFQAATRAMPMLKDGRPAGTIAMARTAPGRFPQRQIGLPRIFAKVEERIEAETVGELTLKGFARTVHAHNVLAAN